MVRDSVRSVSPSSFFVRHTSLQKNVNGGVEPWSLVTKGKTLVTKGNDLGDEREDLDDQRKDANESKAAMPQRVKQVGQRQTSCQKWERLGVSLISCPQGLEKSATFF